MKKSNPDPTPSDARNGSNPASAENGFTPRLVEQVRRRRINRRVVGSSPGGELNPVSELPPTTRFTENAESVPLGVFYWRPVFRGIPDTTANSPEVSGSLFNSGSPTDPPEVACVSRKSGPKLSD
jgi:hypothetical protein